VSVNVVGVECWGSVFTMTMNKNRSKQKRCTKLKIYHKTTHTEHQKLREKSK